MEKSVDVCLVEMPFSSTASPVFSLSILKGCLNRAGILGEVVYGNMIFAKRVGVEDYARGLSCFPEMVLFGEAVFAGVAHQKPEMLRRYRELLFNMNCDNPEYLPAGEALFHRLERAAEPFIEELGDLILQKRPKVVALSSLFFQNNACIALTKYLKAQNPAIITMIGGANAVAETAWGLVKCNRSIDYAFSGEADEIFAEVCQRLIDKGDIPREAIPYGLLRADMELDGKTIPVRQTKNLDDMPYPDYDDYFASLKRYDHEKYVYPAIFMEFSRGCWWNMKKPCNFCGLNAASHKYRIKTTERVMAEIEYLAKRYNIKKFTVTDNILSPIHLKELLPLLAEKDYIFFGEVKSSLTRDEIYRLKKAGFILLQPGIESLQDDLLELMNKGNRAIKHVELLKNLGNAGIATIWHMLVGFPGEKDEYYEEMTKLIPLITHLQAPKQVAHIAFVRSSEYVNNAEKYGLSLEPGAFYECIYPDEEFIKLSAIRYFPVDSALTLRGGEIWTNTPQRKAFSSMAEAWQDHFRVIEDMMTVRDTGYSLEIFDLRSLGAVKSIHELKGVEREVALAADEVTTREEIAAKLQGKYDANEIAAALETLINNHLVVDIKGELLFLPLRDDHPPTVKDMEKRPHGYYRNPVFLCYVPKDRVVVNGEN